MAQLEFLHALSDDLQALFNLHPIDGQGWGKTDPVAVGRLGQ